jgi:hypothetical protein
VDNTRKKGVISTIKHNNMVNIHGNLFDLNLLLYTLDSMSGCTKMSHFSSSLKSNKIALIRFRIFNSER